MLWRDLLVALGIPDRFDYGYMTTRNSETPVDGKTGIADLGVIPCKISSNISSMHILKHV